MGLLLDPAEFRVSLAASEALWRVCPGLEYKGSSAALPSRLQSDLLLCFGPFGGLVFCFLLLGVLFQGLLLVLFFAEFEEQEEAS